MEKSEPEATGKLPLFSIEDRNWEEADGKG
jgi:hypothetical protein